MTPPVNRRTRRFAVDYAGLTIEVRATSCGAARLAADAKLDRPRTFLGIREP